MALLLEIYGNEGIEGRPFVMNILEIPDNAAV